MGRLLALSLPPATGAWMRYIACMIAFYIWFVYKAASGQSIRWLPGSRDSWWRVSVIALFAVMGYQLLFMHGMRFTAAGDASLIITMNPIFTVLLAAPILGQRITRKMIYGLLLSFIGVVVVTGWSPNTDIPLDERLKGDLMIMLAALCWATATNLTRIMLESEGEHGATSTEIVVWYSLVGTILLDPMVAVGCLPWWDSSPEQRRPSCDSVSQHSLDGPGIHLVRSGCREDRCDIRILLCLSCSAVRSSGWLATFG